MPSEETARTPGKDAPSESGRSRMGWFVLVAAGVALMVMGMWGMQRRSEAIELLRATRTMLDARDTGDQLVDQVARETRAEMVSEFEKHVPKYALQEMGMFGAGLVMFLIGLAGTVRRGRAE